MIKSNKGSSGASFCEGVLIMFKSFLFALSLLGADSFYADSLQPVVVTADKGFTVSRIDTLGVSNSSSVADVLLLSSGLHVGDNGGLSGLKTISLRGLGSAHTAIYIDGVRVGNVQSGQNDLGMIGMENVGSVHVDYAQNSVSFNTTKPEFGKSAVVGKAALSVGSFGTWQPYARIDYRLSDYITLSANVAGVMSKGDFKYGDGQKRVNNDLKQIRAGLDLWGRMESGEYHVKGYFNQSERGTPGSVLWPSDDRQKDKNMFLQAVLCKGFSSLYSLNLSAKASYDDIFYSSSWGDSRYGQSELQLNAAHNLKLFSWWQMSLSTALEWDSLKSTVYNASRLSVNAVVSSAFDWNRLDAKVALEYGGAFDMTYGGRNYFSPSADLRFSIVNGLDLIAFARRAYRVPTFNELYYVGYGNPSLKSEDAWLTDLGFDYHKELDGDWALKAKLDGFYTRLKNKITSAPSPEDPNIWAPYNIGIVRSVGTDVLFGFAHEGEWNYGADVKYTYQSAVDLTPDSATYGEQIPYIAKHSLVFSGNLQWKKWSLSPIWQLRSGRSDGYGDLPSWNTFDIRLAKSVSIRKVGILSVNAVARNLFDERFETVSGYPMPGRNFTVGVELKF